jgi:hypothetical protein
MERRLRRVEAALEPLLLRAVATQVAMQANLDPDEVYRDAQTILAQLQSGRSLREIAIAADLDADDVEAMTERLLTDSGPKWRREDWTGSPTR